MSAPLHPGQLEVLEQAPAKYRSIVREAFEGASSPRRAIKACCLTCTHYDRAEIRFCRVVRCPLHRYRPYQEGEPEKEQPGNRADDGRG